MKQVKLMLVMFVMTLLTIQTSAQSVNTSLYYTTNDTHIAGIDLYASLNGLVLGIGGSHATKSFFVTETKDGNDYRDHNNNVAKNFPELTNPANSTHFRGNFVENRGTLTGIVGYVFNKTTITSDLGVSFRQRILLGNTGTYPINAPTGFYYQSQTLSPAFLYGGTVIQNIKGRFGILAGYNNIEKFKFGVNIRLTPTKIFKW